MTRAWFRKRAENDSALDEEIRSHFAMAVADRIARGESPDAALAAARREFGNVGHIKEVTRETWGGVWIERFVQDLRYAARSLRRSPGFAAIAVITLALGIGVNTAMFTVMNGVLLRPLPFPDAGRLFVPSFQPPPGPFSRLNGLFDSHFLAIEKERAIFEHVATVGTPNVTLRGVGEPMRLMAGAATSQFFDVFGVAPAIGRTFGTDDADAGRDNVAVLSDRLWRTRFGADRAVLGKVIDVDGTRRTVIGVMPASFDVPAHTDLWIPLTVTTSTHEIRTRIVVARIDPRLTVEQARGAWITRASHLVLPEGIQASELVSDLVPLKQIVIGDARPPLLILTGAVALVLLIACANVANLLLMRVTTRDREMAVRAALGAGRARLLRQLLTETFLVAAVGAGLGILVAALGVRIVVAVAPSAMMPRAANVHLDGWVLLFTVGLTVATTIVCGLIPALHASDDRLRSSLAEGARTMSAGRGRIRSALVVGEIALSLVLLVGAGLMLRSLHAMQNVDLGFSPSSAIVASVSLPQERYRTAADERRFHYDALERLARIPGVDAVAAVNWRPLGMGLIVGDFHLENGRKLPPNYQADKIVVTPGYAKTIGLRVLQGRDFTADDDKAGAPNVVLISESVARRLWPRGDAVGHRITMDDKPTPSSTWLTIVGVVNDVVQASVTAKPDPAIYQLVSQVETRFFLEGMSYVVRPSPSGATSAIAPAMRAILRDADPSLPLEPVQRMTDLIRWTMGTSRFQSWMLLAFSVLALTLAMIGIYGVLAYGVSQRQHEIGIRVALGATPGEVRAMVLRRSAVLAAVGLALGVVASIAFTRVLAKLLFQIEPTDPVTFAAVAVLLAGVAFGAAYVPARRASRVDPLVALRGD